MTFGSVNSGNDTSMSETSVMLLVDMMSVLLIVFMTITPVLTHLILLELPTTSEQAAKKEKQPVDPSQLTIGVDGSYYFDAESVSKVSIEGVVGKLKAAKAEKEGLTIAIAADKSAGHDYVNKALEVARKADISKIGFIAETRSVTRQSINSAILYKTERPSEE